MKVHFRGGEADDHRIDLYTGAESLSGLGRAANLVAHYVATGEVRFRSPYSNKIQFYITGSEDGSLTIILDEITRIANEARAAASRSKTRKLLRRVINRAIGKAEAGALPTPDGTVSEGDIDALAEAATPGLTRAHRWINTEGKSISLEQEEGRPMTLNQETREYMESEEVSARVDLQDVSVGALNVNSRNGRVFFHDLGRTVPFYVPRDAEARTIPNLSRYLTQYAERTGATVNIRFRRVRYPDERLKRVIIYDCYGIRDAG
jgi:hypothetical protein